MSDTYLFIELFIHSFLNYFYFQRDDQRFCNPVGNMETKVSPQIITGYWCITVITVLKLYFRKDYLYFKCQILIENLLDEENQTCQ